MPKSDKTRPGKNGGTLNIGNPGNKGSTGRPTNEHRNQMKALHWRAGELMGKRLKEIEEAVEAGGDVDLDALMDIADHAAKYGIGTKTEMEVSDLRSVEEILEQAEQR